MIRSRFFLTNFLIVLGNINHPDGQRSLLTVGQCALGGFPHSPNHNQLVKSDMIAIDFFYCARSILLTKSTMGHSVICAW